MVSLSVGTRVLDQHGVPGVHCSQPVPVLISEVSKFPTHHAALQAVKSHLKNYILSNATSAGVKIHIRMNPPSNITLMALLWVMTVSPIPPLTLKSLNIHGKSTCQVPLDIKLVNNLLACSISWRERGKKEIIGQLRLIAVLMAKLTHDTDALMRWLDWAALLGDGVQIWGSHSSVFKMVSAAKGKRTAHRVRYLNKNQTFLTARQGISLELFL